MSGSAAKAYGWSLRASTVRRIRAGSRSARRRAPTGRPFATIAASETQQTYYDSRPYRYTCPSGFTLKTATVPPTCTKTETYRKKVCSFDPIVGQQCWWENRTRTLTKPATQTCPSGYSPDGTGCTADRASKRWVRTASTPTRHRYVPAARSCIAGYSPAGPLCQADRASTRWVRTSSTPTRHRYVPAVRSCIAGYSPAGSVCQADTASTRWVETGSTPAKFRYVPAAKSCMAGYSDNGTQCQADKASTRWVRTSSTPTRHRFVPAVKSCPAGWSDNGARCESDTASTRWDRTSSVPVTSRTADAVRSCDAGFVWNATAGKCDKTTYSDPTGPLTRLVGDAPQVSCRDGYSPAGGGRCTRTTLGEPTAVPAGAGCIADLGTLPAGSISRSGTLGAGCVSLRKGDAQSPHWARRFSLRVAAASTATFTVSSSAADVFVYVLSGSGTAVVEVASDDDSGTGTDAKIADVALAAGTTYTVEVTTAAANIAGAFTLTATIAAVEPPVAISGLADTTRTGAGSVAVAAAFAVEPAAAVCTAAAGTAGVAPTVAVGPAAHQRTVTVTAAAPFSHTVTVTCDAPGRTATQAAVTLAAVAQQVRIGGLDDSVPSGATTTGGVAYAVDVFTVEPATARCVGTANGRGAAAPQISSRTGTRTAVVRLSPGGAATVTVTCTAPGHSPGVAHALFSWTPRPQIAAATAAFAPKDACTATAPDQNEDADADAAYRCVLAQGAALVATLTAVADHATIAAAWATDSALTAAPSPAAAATPVIGPDNAATGDWHTTATATLRCTAHGTAKATLTAGRHPATDTHTTAVHIDCQTPVRIDGLDDAAGHGSTGAAATVADDFTVTPADAQCTAAPIGTVTAPDPARPQHRLLSAEVTAGTAVTVTVTCTAEGRADSTQDVELAGVASDCDDPLGSVIHGVTVRDGTIANDPGCVSAGRGLSGTFYARRHTFTLDAAARVTVDVSGEAGVDAYVVLYRGHDAAAAAVLRRDDNSGPSSDPRLRGVRLAAGDYTVEATTAQAQATGGYRVTVSAAYISPVRISGLADAVGAGTGAVIVTEPFTVTPAAAACTASPPAASVAAGSGRRRAVSATLDGPGSLEVTVTCTAARRGPAAADLTLTHAGALTSIAARITAGGGECTATRAPRRVDAAYRCMIGRANTATVAADITATGPAVDTAWDTTGGITASNQRAGTATPAFGPDNSVTGWQRTATARLECTANGTATATASLAGTSAKKTARLTITCADAVHIDGLADTADTADNGTGTLTVTSSFTVTPADAACTADPTTATVTAGVGGARTLTASIAVPGTLAVTVTCKAAGRADGVRNVNLTAARPCSTHLGTLATGTVARSGAIADDGCVAQARLPRTATVFYAARRAHWAKRHTFALKTPGWVTVSIGNSPANAEPLDTYAVLLKDDNTKGTVIARNDNASRRRTDARLADLFLLPGSYTIEATTKQPQTAGSYTLRVDATVTGLQDSYNATVGRELRIDFDLGKFHAAATASHADLGVRAHRSGTVGTLRLAPSRALTRTVTVTFSQAPLSSGGAHGAAGASAGFASSTWSRTISIPTTCDRESGQIPGPHPNGTCIWDTDENLAAIEIGGNKRGSQLYEVTPALLDGAKRVAAQALADHPRCGMRTGQLAAVMIAIGYWEYPINNARGSNRRAPARSLMTLSRSHLDRHQALYPENQFKQVVDVGAFWHPGVGYWQLDYWPMEMGHAERADIDKGGRAVANELARSYCRPGPDESAEDSLRDFLDGSSGTLGGWTSCVGDDSGDHLCYETFQKIYLGVESFSGTERLWVTTAQNSGDHHTRGGGVHDMSCRFGATGTDFPCWFYDTESASIEGAFSAENKRGITGGDSPLAAPFMSFTHGPKGNRTNIAVFPESFAYPADASGTKVTWIKAVPTGTVVRKTVSASWHEDDYDEDNDGTSGDKELYVNICPPHISGVPDRCERLSSTDRSFAATVRKAYPGDTPGDGR